VIGRKRKRERQERKEGERGKRKERKGRNACTNPFSNICLTTLLGDRRRKGKYKEKKGGKKEGERGRRTGTAEPSGPGFQPAFSIDSHRSPAANEEKKAKREERREGKKRGKGKKQMLWNAACHSVFLSLNLAYPSFLRALEERGGGGKDPRKKVGGEKKKKKGEGSISERLKKGGKRGKPRNRDRI